MPAKWAQFAIVAFWIAMTGWLVQRDVLPRLGYGELNYRGLLAERAVEETSRWRVHLDDRLIGSVITTVRPIENGAYVLSTHAAFDVGAGIGLDENASALQVDSNIFVSPLGRLESFQMRVALKGTDIRLTIDGTVKGNELVAQVKGISLLEGELTIPIDPETVFVDRFGGVDRLPRLRVGKSWTTRSVNPVSSLFSGSGLFGRAAPTIEVVQHRVVDVERINWDGRDWACHVVEHRYSGGTSKTWARVSDGRVLRQTVPFGTKSLMLEQEPMVDSP